MNEFSKDELIDIRSGIRLLLEEDHCDSRYTIEIRSLEDKIQLMIDSYCEHNFEITYRMKEITECKKCGLELYYDKY